MQIAAKASAALERYYIKPATVDRIRKSWLAPSIEHYVQWLTERRFSASSVHHRVWILVRFGEFSRRRGVLDVCGLRDHLDAFVRYMLRRRTPRSASPKSRSWFIRDVRRPIDGMLRVIVPHPAAHRPQPFEKWAPNFFAHLREERGLSVATIDLYRRHLMEFECFVSRRRVREPSVLSPSKIDEFIGEQRRRMRPVSLRSVCSALRSFLRYLFRQGATKADLADTVEGPRTYRLSGIPRSIAWADVLRTLNAIDRRAGVGKRDYAILFLLAVYGLRAREVAALTIDDLDWRGATLRIRGRKAAHSTAYPLSDQMATALIDYIKNARPAVDDRHVFMKVMAPRGPVTAKVVADCAGRRLKAAGVAAPRLGSHTLRHSVAQRLVDGGFSLKGVGDYLGHGAPQSTQIYSKIDVESLREVALGDGEAVL